MESILATPGKDLPPHWPWIELIIRQHSPIPAVIMAKKKRILGSSIFSLEHILPAQEFILKPEKVLRDCGKEFIAQIYKYIRVLKAQCTRSLKLNIQTRAAVARCCQVWCLY